MWTRRNHGFEVSPQLPPGEEPKASETTPVSPEELARLRDIMDRITKVRGAIAKTEGLANLLDTKFSIAGIKFGLDAIIGGALEIVGLDWIGDIPTTLASLYLIWQAKEAGVPPLKIAKMLSLVGLEFAADLIPVLGSIADLFIHANVKNVAIMKRYADELEVQRDAIK